VIDGGYIVTGSVPTRSASFGTLPHRDPVVWLILSEKTGDNAQLLALAEVLPWPCLIKRIAVQEPYRLGKPHVSASLSHIDLERSDALEPPWPDLVITIGRRMSMAALWIQAQAKGHARLVLLGTPKRLTDRFDLAVVSEQYRHVHRSNIMRITYPLQRVDEASITAEAEASREEFARYPRPLIAVLVGGSTKAVRFDSAIAGRLARDVAELARREGGTLFVTTSRRTPPVVVETLQRELPPDAILYRWGEDASKNPYKALLGLADRFVVTSDSLSMMMEISRLGRPLALYRLPSSNWLARSLSDPMGGGGAPGRRVNLLAPLDALAARLTTIGRNRDLTAIPQRLVKDGFAVWFGEPFKLDGRRPPDELHQVAARVVDLMRRQQGAVEKTLPSTGGKSETRATTRS
jgi:uncharacterized protein